MRFSIPTEYNFVITSNLGLYQFRQTNVYHRSCNCPGFLFTVLPVFAGAVSVPVLVLVPISSAAPAA